MGKVKIYLVENCYGDSNKVYIGKTKNSRKSSHRGKFGVDITYSYIDEMYTLNKNEWKELESYWIDQFKQWGFEVMNKNQGGGGPNSHSISSREKMSNSRKGRKLSWGDKISKSKKGCKVWSKGKKFTEEHKRKISERKKGKSNPPQSYINNKNNIKPILQYSLNMVFIKEWESAVEASKFYNISSNSIRNCCNNKTKTSLGFIWKNKN